MEVSLLVSGGTALDLRFQVVINDKECGELTMPRAEATKFIDLLFGDEIYQIKGRDIIKKPAPQDVRLGGGAGQGKEGGAGGQG